MGEGRGGRGGGERKGRGCCSLLGLALRAWNGRQWKASGRCWWDLICVTRTQKKAAYAKQQQHKMRQHTMQTAGAHSRCCSALGPDCFGYVEQHCVAVAADNVRAYFAVLVEFRVVKEMAMFRITEPQHRTSPTLRRSRTTSAPPRTTPALACRMSASSCMALARLILLCFLFFPSLSAVRIRKGSELLDHYKQITSFIEQKTTPQTLPRQLQAVPTLPPRHLPRLPPQSNPPDHQPGVPRCDALKSPEFIAFLQNLTKIEYLFADPRDHGGGLHQVLKGGSLNLHTDFQTCAWDEGCIRSLRKDEDSSVGKARRRVNCFCT